MRHAELRIVAPLIHVYEANSLMGRWLCHWWEGGGAQSSLKGLVMKLHVVYICCWARFKGAHCLWIGFFGLWKAEKRLLWKYSVGKLSQCEHQHSLLLCRTKFSTPQNNGLGLVQDTRRMKQFLKIFVWIILSKDLSNFIKNAFIAQSAQSRSYNTL